MEAVQASPLLEKLVKKGYDVMLMTEPIDEYAMQVLDKYDGKYKFINVGKEDLEMEEDEHENLKELEEEFKPLTEYLKKTLMGKVTKVKLTNRLITTPCALVSSTYGMSANMERIFRSQALSDQRARRMYSYATGQRVLELNPRHPIVKQLLNKVVEDDESPEAEDIATVLYDAAILSSGYSLDEPSDFTVRIHKMIASNLHIDYSELEALAEEEAATQTVNTEEIPEESKEEL